MADDFFKKTSDFLKKGSQFISDKLNLDITHLIEAVRKNDQEMVQRCLTAGIDPNQPDSINRRALPIAVDNLNPHIVKILLIGNANPNLPGREGESALFKAVSWNNEEIVKMLLQKGGDIHKKNKNILSPLEEAQRKGFSKMVSLLENFKKEKKAEQRAEDLATHEEMKAKADEVKKLREQKAAAAKKQAAIKAKKAAQQAQAKIEKKYNAQENGILKALLQAIENEDAAAVDLFIQKIESPNAVDPDFKTTPLLAAISKKNTVAVKTLIEKGADTLAVVEEQHHSALTLSVSMNAHKLVQFILENLPKDEDGQEGNFANVLNDPGAPLSPTFLAYKDAKMLNFLLKAGADPYFGGEHGRSPVVKAIEKASVAILPVLAKHKVDLNQATEEKTPLEWAIHFNRKDWVVGLIEEEVDCISPNEAGQTPLDFATQLGDREDIVMILKEKMAEE